jgi:hypothetical protein
LAFKPGLVSAVQETFYSTFAQLAFALLGLWWVVVQFRHQEWMKHPPRRRMALYVSLYFALPGIMSLLSLLAENATFIWRVAFALAGLAGVIAGVQMALLTRSPWERTWTWAGAVLFAVIAIVAGAPGVIATLGLSMTPIQVEGIVLAVVLLVGVAAAWHMFAQPLDDAGAGEP